MEFTQNLAYLLGLWYHCKYGKGVGVKGKAKDIFVEVCKELCLSERFLYTKNSAWFYNHRVKNKLEKYIKERRHRFIAINDYSASYFAGWFDCCGKIKENKVVLCNFDSEDSFILTRLNFIHETKRNSLFILKPIAFIKFISNYTRLNKEILEGII